jgi:hypothetical protein
MATLALLLHPELRLLPPARRRAALRRAWRTAFDTFELLGMAAALIGAALLARYALEHWLGATTPAAAFGFVAVSVLAAVGPFILRRTRRGLRSALQDIASP